jgi:hypothetical protein
MEALSQHHKPLLILQKCTLCCLMLSGIPIPSYPLTPEAWKGGDLAQESCWNV